MKTMLKMLTIRRVVLGVALGGLFVFFYSCSDLIDKITAGEDVAVSDSLFVTTGYIDSSEARKTGLNRFDDFVLRFPVAQAGGEYEIRLSSTPITGENWSKAQPVLYKVLSADSTVFVTDPNGGIDTMRYQFVTVHLQPEIDWNACTGCRECVKSREPPIHRTWSFPKSGTPGVYQLYTNEDTRNENPDLKVCARNAISVVDGKARIDMTKCTACGACFKACPYNAISDCSYGRYYYFAVRKIGQGDDSTAVIATRSKYKINYENWVWKDPAKAKITLNRICDFCQFAGCHANHLSHSLGIDRDTCDAVPSKTFVAGCPVGALYSNIDTSSVTANPEFGAIYIDPAKCISCGICFERCLDFGRHSIQRRVVAAVE